MDFDLKLYSIFAAPCGLLELYISKKKFFSTVDKSSSSKDHGSFKWLWIVISASQSFVFYCLRRNFGSKIIADGPMKYFLWVPCSIILYLIGHRIRHQAIEQLGQWFTTIVRTNSQQELIQSGWYSKMRHPSYTGCLTYFFALGMMSNNYWAFLAIVLPLWCVFRYRISVEEKVLSEHFRGKYDEYRRKVPNMIWPKFFSS